jgi:apolipoprotein N-acyltransferase/predicted NAD-dependent protein-ADP-ribosyltransferase YbiA (DUF1768 family)
MASLPLGVSARDGAAAIGAALLGAAAYPPIGAWPLTLVSTALFLRLIRDQDTLTARNLGVVYGVTYALGTMYWFFAVFGTYAIPLFGLMAAYFGLLATLIAMTRGQGPLTRAALTALFAVAVEWLRGDAWYLRFPWYTPGHALAQAPAWIAAARWLGAYGLSYVIWFIVAVGAFGRPLAWTAIALLPAAWFLLPAVEPPDRRVLLIQTEEPGGGESVFADIPPEPVDLAVLPEYAYTCAAKLALATPRGPAGLARKVSAPVVFGAVDGDYYGGTFTNLAIVIDAQGRIQGQFPKQRPVPLMRDGTPGTTRPVFPVKEGVLGVAICYDLDAPAIAGDLVRDGATVLVTPTYDAIWWTRMQHLHHELLIRLRAVETDRWVLRAASSGRTEVIDPNGVPSAAGVEIGETGFVVLPFGHRTTRPLGAQLFLLGPAFAAAALLFVVVSVWRWLGRRRRGGGAVVALMLANINAGCWAPTVPPAGPPPALEYPSHWWEPVPKEGAPSWEILPQEAGPGEVILSKRHELGLLSNFAATPFTFHGKRYASLEGFWQMMLYPEGDDDPRATFRGNEWKLTREQVAQLTAFEAKKAGSLASENMKRMGITWVSFEGKRFEYKPAEPGEHYRLIVAATWEKVRQNPEVKRVLLATGDLKLRPDHHTEPNAPAAWRYYDILTEIRGELASR